MDECTVRVLLLADTHLGFDEPQRPRVVKRRRGPDFFACYEKALEPALRGEADLVVHGGDLLFRARVPASLVQRAMEPLFRVANRGVPVFVVPGNHERSRIPFPLLTYHPLVHVFDRPRTFAVEVRGMRAALSGFPFERVVDGDAFPEHVARTQWDAHPADVRLLCMHQAVEGATVGVQQFTFRRGPDVVPGHAVPPQFAAVLSGHIHRTQVLALDLQHRPLAAPVCYPGSIERTSFAERDETKGYLMVRLAAGALGGRLVDWDFVPLPARPMRIVELDVEGLPAPAVRDLLRAELHAIEPDAVVRIVVRGSPDTGTAPVLCAAGLRRLAPPTMTIDLAPPPGRFDARRRRRAAR
jgi:DNA repair exonuclease SbcCD nuclease subunit